MTTRPASRRWLLALAPALALAPGCRSSDGTLPDPATFDVGEVPVLSTKDCLDIALSYVDVLNAKTKEEAAVAVEAIKRYHPPDPVVEALEFDIRVAGKAADPADSAQRQRESAILAKWQGKACPASAQRGLSASPSTPATGG